jgi:hypothetical protein
MCNTNKDVASTKVVALVKILSDGEYVELLVYLVEEEKDIYIGVLVLVCHFATYLATWGLRS